MEKNKDESKQERPKFIGFNDGRLLEYRYQSDNLKNAMIFKDGNCFWVYNRKGISSKCKNCNWNAIYRIPHTKIPYCGLVCYKSLKKC